MKLLIPSDPNDPRDVSASKNITKRNKRYLLYTTDVFLMCTYALQFSCRGKESFQTFFEPQHLMFISFLVLESNNQTCLTKLNKLNILKANFVNKNKRKQIIRLNQYKIEII